MPDKRTIEKADRDLREGKSASTAAGEFVHSEIDKIRAGEHGAKNAKQAIAIGLSEARRAGVPIRDNPNRKSKSSSKRASPRRRTGTPSSAKRARATMKALKRMPRKAASHSALSRQAKGAARKRSAASRSAAARKGARTRAARSR